MAASPKFEIKVPEAGESVQEAMIESWLVDDGALVDQDEPVVELETDKASMELVSEQVGHIKILVPAQQMVQVGQVIATISPTSNPPTKDQATDQSPAQPAADLDPSSPTQPKTAETAENTRAADDTTAPNANPQAKLITTSSPHGPAAQVMAQKHEISLENITPDHSPKTRITKQDIATHLKQPPPTVTAPQAGTPARQSEQKPLSLMRKRIAERLLSATQTTAMLTTFNEVDMTEIIALRTRYKDIFLSTHNTKLGFMGFFIQASAQALKEFPNINAFLQDDHIITHHYADIGVAVATEKGLVVPVIQNAEMMDLHTLEHKLVELAHKARHKSLKIHEMQGGTFTITNGGVFGSLLSTPILNPPQSAILGMHKIDQRAQVMPDGSIQARPMMYLALSYDHRIVDGKDAVSFLARIKQLLEEPARLWLKI